MILKYNKFNEEISYKKIEKMMKSVNDLTFSIEIELETNDKSGMENEYTDLYKSNIMSNIRNSVIKELRRISNYISDDKINFLDDILSQMSSMDEDEMLKIVDRRFYNLDYQKLIIDLIYPQCMTYFHHDNFEYLEDKLSDFLPNFMKEYKDILKVEMDNTLDRGVELSNKTYFYKIDDLLKMIKLFYSDLNKQSFWMFSERTGIHINIGSQSGTFNILKGLLFMNDIGENPYIFSKMEWRNGSKFCGSLLGTIKENDLIKVKLLPTNESELILNKILLKNIKEIGYKTFGVNIIPVQSFKYIEYRYIGGNISEEVLISKIKYLSYITNLMIGDFERKEYLKKLYKFINK